MSVTFTQPTTPAERPSFDLPPVPVTSVDYTCSKGIRHRRPLGFDWKDGRSSPTLSLPQGLQLSVAAEWCKERSQLILEVQLHNPNRAQHPGGYWDLGDAGSILFTDLSFTIEFAQPANKILWCLEPDQSPAAAREFFSIYQESSGGENYRSAVHINRDGRLPHELAGFELNCDGETQHGARATPIVVLAWPELSLGVCLRDFWQKFPSAIEASCDTITIRLFPQQYPDLHELQAGERCTNEIHLQFGSGSGFDWQALRQAASTRLPAIERAIPPAARLCQPQDLVDVRPEYRQVLNTAITSFITKREHVDEYGWRHFGDMWADHEEAHADGERPVISHYNNQYDLLHSLIVHFLSTRDQGWWNLADALARHILDIDIYSTEYDKPAYNHGLHWHTAHYLSAGTAGHRSMSRSMIGKDHPAPGGGPSNEHNYATGMLLYHWLTGSQRAAEAVAGFADWVIAMDDGEQHSLGVASRAKTGLASSTAQTDFHGPGRGVGNSINTLVDGWLLSHKSKYLQKAVELIRRAVHPAENIERLDLGNAELRWSYTVCLQALYRFLVVTDGETEYQPHREYVRASLLHYGEWMYHNERFYLDYPAELEFPTETWAAQELRKGNVLLMIGTLDCERTERYQIRANQILDRAWESLHSFPTWDYCRPLAIALQQGPIEHYFRTTTEAPPKFQESVMDFGERDEFVPQKTQIKRAMKSLSGLIGLAYRAIHPRPWLNNLRRSRSAAKLRRMLSR